MPSYLCCFLDQDQRTVGLSETIEAADLSRAIDKAQAILEARPHYQGVELWDGGKRVYPAARASGRM
jgi:hypothetical protein